MLTDLLESAKVLCTMSKCPPPVESAVRAWGEKNWNECVTSVQWSWKIFLIFSCCYCCYPITLSRSRRSNFCHSRSMELETTDGRDSSRWGHIFMTISIMMTSTTIFSDLTLLILIMTGAPVRLIWWTHPDPPSPSTRCWPTTPPSPPGRSTCRRGRWWSWWR